MRTAPIPAAVSARASRSPRAPAPNSPISNSCNSIRPRSTGRRGRCRWSAKPCAAKAPFSSTRPASASWPTCPRRGAGAARRRRARDLATARRGPSRVSRCAPGARRTRSPARFPVIAAFCREAGIDPARQPIPVRPAAHYHMGGIAVDAEGRGSLRGLWACGEAACDRPARRQSPGEQFPDRGRGVRRAVAESVAGASFARGPPPRPTRTPPAPDPRAVRPILSAAAGVMRDGEGLARAVARAGAAGARDRAVRRSRRRRADDRGRRLAARGEPRRASPHRFSRQGERGASHDAAARLGARLGGGGAPPAPARRASA